MFLAAQKTTAQQTTAQKSNFSLHFLSLEPRSKSQLTAVWTVENNCLVCKWLTVGQRDSARTVDPMAATVSYNSEK